MESIVQLRKANTMPETFADFVEREQERVNSELERWRLERSKIGDAMYALERELSAIAAYITAKTGKSAAPVRPTRVRQGSRRDEIVALIRDHGPLPRKDILSKMGLKGNRQGEMSVSNQLTKLAAAGGALVRADGKYRVA